jgi:hypothetical protein
LLQGRDAAVTGYARANTRIYLYGQVVPQADPTTFEIFNADVGMTRDRRNVYFNGRSIPGADPHTIMQIQGYAFKDRNYVYMEGRKIAGLKPASVRVSEFGTYLMDDAIVVKNGIEIAGRDAASFRELQSPWTLDKRGVYYQDQLVPEIDPVTFTTNALNRGEDRNYRYEGLTKVCRFGSGPIQSLPACT